MNKRIRRVASDVIMICLAGILLVSGWKVFTIMRGYHADRAVYENIAEAAGEPESAPSDPVLGLVVMHRNFGKGYEYSVNFRITVNPDTWALTVLQNGYRYYPGGSGVSDPVKFTETTADGRVVECSTPQLLDEYGYDNRGGEPVYATFAAYPSKNWAGLKLPATL